MTHRVAASTLLSGKNRNVHSSTSAAQKLLDECVEVSMNSLVRLLGFKTLGCGCIAGRYRELATHREITYIEEKGAGCIDHAHRRNHTIASARFGAPAQIEVAQAS